MQVENQNTDEFHKVFVFYDPTGDVSAFTEDKTISSIFEITRSRKYYRKRKIKMNEQQYRAFLYLHKDEMLFMNVLTDGEKSFDYVTTYRENFELDTACDTVFDKMIDFSRSFLEFPLTDEVEKSLEVLYNEFMNGEPKYQKYSTFNLFLNLFKERIL